MKMDIYGKVFFIGEIIAILLISFHFEYYVGLITLLFPLSSVYIHEYKLKENISYLIYFIQVLIFFYGVRHIFIESFYSKSSIENFLFYSWVIFWPFLLILHFIKIHENKTIFSKEQ